MHFNNEDKLLAWIYALECTAKGSTSPTKGGINSVLRKLQPAKDANKSSVEAKLVGNAHDCVQSSMAKHVARLGLARDGLEERLASLSAKPSSNLKISVTAATEYKLCTTDPQGDDSDTWALVRATFLQVFRISGDRIVRGKEIVRIEVSHCAGLDGTEQTGAEDNTLSPTSGRLSLVRRGRLRVETP